MRKRYQLEQYHPDNEFRRLDFKTIAGAIIALLIIYIIVAGFLLVTS